MGQKEFRRAPSCIVTLNYDVLFDVKKLLKLEASWILLNIDVLSDKIDPSDDEIMGKLCKVQIARGLYDYNDVIDL